MYMCDRICKNGLIAGESNCSYSLFSTAKSIFVNFLFSSNKNITLMLYVHTIILPGELSKE